MLTPALPSIAKIAELLGGDVQGAGVLCPGPGHSAGDRSLSVKPDPADREGFVTHSFAGDSWKDCRDHVRNKLGLPEPRSEPQQKTNGGKAAWTTLAEHIYRNQNGERFLKVKKCRDETGKRQYPQFHWNGSGWAKGKPQGSKIPYRLPELIAAPKTALVYFCEGEKDADTIANIGFVATTASKGSSAKWDAGLTQFFKDRHVVILPDADRPGRAHAQKVAKAINGVAASVRIVDLYPERHDGSDVSDFIANDTAGVRLAREGREAPLWGPSGPATSADDAEPEEDESADTVELRRLAQLPPLQYERERRVAAEKLGISRVAMLDRMVAVERAKLGLDGDDDADLQGKAIKFAEPELWPTEVDGAALLNAMAAAIRQHVVMSNTSSHLATLWVLHSWLIDCFVISPRLGVLSATKGCGKTLLLDVLGRMVRRPLRTLSITPAATFRIVEGWQPSLLIDEADTFLNDNEGLRGILDGNRKGDTVLRTVGNDFEVRAFATYAAVAIALIGTLPDTLHDRSVVIDLKRRLKKEKIAPFRFDRAGHLDVLARMTARWAQDNTERVAAMDPKMPEGIINREADNWRPLAMIAAVAGGRWPARLAKAATAAHTDAIKGDTASTLEMLLADIRDAFATDEATKVRDMAGAEQIEITSAALVKALVALDGRPWAEIGKDRKPITQNRLARMLKALKPPVVPQKVGPKTARVSGYVLAHFKEAFERYLPMDGVSQPDNRTQAHEMGTSCTSQPDTMETGCPVEKCEKSNNDGTVSGCPVAKGVSGEEHDVCGYCGRSGGNEVFFSDGQTARLHRECEALYRSF